MQFKYLASATIAAFQLVSASPIPSGQFQWGSTKVRGVNLGGWLVLEPWITPSIFQSHPPSDGIVDEYTLCQKMGNAAASSILQQHWQSWITQADIQQIAGWGFNMVRIPIGFWAYQSFGTPYVQGAATYLDQAVGWASAAGIKVIVDLHGAPMSQNGFDNSGQRMSTPQWEGGDSVNQTLQVLHQIAGKYAGNPTVMGIELLNEPLSSELDVNVLKQFFRDGYGQVRADSQTTPVVIQDAFMAPSSYNGFLTPSDNNAQNVALDHHEYQVFTDAQVGMTPAQHVQAVCSGSGAYSGSDKWSFIGEWTGAMTDCAAALNGYGIGARYDGTYQGSTYHGSCSNINYIDTWDAQLVSDTRNYIIAQLQTFEAVTDGWTFWTYKTEASAEWDLGRLIGKGAFPLPPDPSQYAPMCG
ncbi:MAG: exo-1,3-beta-glucanase [Chrysothrix sp. TS-e1954]|nr:MAG: exo-1,3-beta-glucanase [Chrysothrix sp. TS-e1954]